MVDFARGNASFADVAGCTCGSGDIGSVCFDRGTAGIAGVTKSVSGSASVGVARVAMFWGRCVVTVGDCGLVSGATLDLDSEPSGAVPGRDPAGVVGLGALGLLCAPVDLAPLRGGDKGRMFAFVGGGEVARRVICSLLSFRSLTGVDLAAKRIAI